MTEVTRRQFFAGAAGVAVLGGLATACGSSSSGASTGSGPGVSPSTAAGTPKRGGNFRLGVTGGGTKDIMDGQNITTKPDQARLMTQVDARLRRVYRDPDEAPPLLTTKEPDNNPAAARRLDTEERWQDVPDTMVDDLSVAV